MPKKVSPKASPSDKEKEFKRLLDESNRTRTSMGSAFESKMAEIKKKYSSMID